MTAIFRYAGVLAACLYAASGPLNAQEVEVFFHAASSDHVELPSPIGFGASVQAEFIEDWLFRLTYARATDETRKMGTVCITYAPRIECNPEEVETSVLFRGGRFTLQRALRLGDLLRIGLGGGASFSLLSADAFGVTGRRADLHVPQTGQIGYLAQATLALAPVRAIPLRLTAGYGSHWVDFNGCVFNTDRTTGYTPFCGTTRFDEWQVGVSYVVPGTILSEHQ